jgi:hypothetical protein
MSTKRYEIIPSIEEDAPFGYINWCTISFLTPQKIDSLKHLNVKGFKVHNGYTTCELADLDSKKIKEKNNNHDIYIAQIGKLYSWDDQTKAENIEYDNKKLNELEKVRQENMDKAKLIKKQFENERKTLLSKMDTERLDKIKIRLQKKLYEKGLITKKEYDALQNNKNKLEKKININETKNVQIEIDECYRIDYLDENEPVGLKYGCITFYSPKWIGGLESLYFKIRGLFQTMDELNERIEYLKKNYPLDKLYIFEVGKWCPFTEIENNDQIKILKELNYAMKCYLENLSKENEEYEKRKKSLMNGIEQESKLTKRKTRAQKRNKIKLNQQSKEDMCNISNDKEDDVAIKQIADYLKDT